MEETKYCQGCGALLQTEDENKDGYVHPNALNREIVLCKRCFQLKHYGVFRPGKETYHSIKMIHESVHLDDVLILVLDASLTMTPLLEHLKELNRYKNFYIIANRFELYEEMIKKEKMLDFLSKNIQKAGLKAKKIYLLDHHLETIFDAILQSHEKANLCFAGLENAGKTTLINQFLQKYYPNIPLLTKSLYPGTTLQPLKIPLDATHYLMDTPGIKSHRSMLHQLENSVLKKLQLDKKIVATSYQLCSRQAIHINNFLSFHYVAGEKQTILFYTSAMCTFTRSKEENAQRSFDSLIKDYTIKTNKIKTFEDLTYYDIIIDKKKQDIVIEGFGFITISHPGQFRIYTLKNVNLILRDAMI